MDPKKELDKMTQIEYNRFISRYIPDRNIDKQIIIDQLQNMKDEEIRSRENKYYSKYLERLTNNYDT